jgi:cysteine desulfurase
LIRKLLESELHQKSTIVGENSKNRNLNTVFAIFKGQKSVDLNTRFDLQGIDVSSGAACSSGIVKENRILLNMGFSKDDSMSAIRFSFSPTLAYVEAEKIALAIKKVLN